MLAWSMPWKFCRMNLAFTPALPAVSETSFRASLSSVKLTLASRLAVWSMPRDSSTSMPRAL